MKGPVAERLKGSTAAQAVLTALMLLLVAATLAVFGFRLASVIHFRGLVPVSGLEGSGSLGVYQVCSGAPLYNDLQNRPNIYVFNFLFYYTYGLISRMWISCDFGVPIVGRLFTAVLCGGLFAILIAAKERRTSILQAVVIAAGALSPYIGWWAFSIRPDVGATLILLLSAISMIRYVRNPSLFMALASGFLLCAGWGFKQTFIFAGPIYLFYIARASRVHAALFCVVSLLCLSIPVFLYGTSPYLIHTVAIASGQVLSLQTALENLTGFVVKAAPTIALLGVTICGTRGQKARAESRFILIMTAFSAAIMFVASGKNGASDNYYFPTFVLMLFFAVRTVSSCRDNMRRVALSAYSVGSIALAGMVLSGHAGNLMLKDNMSSLLSAADKINALPGPKLVWDETLALPWFTKKVQTRVTWPYEVGGPEGVFDPIKAVGARYYRSVVVPNASVNRFNLEGYIEEGEIGNLKVYERRPAQ